MPAYRSFSLIFLIIVCAVLIGLLTLYGTKFRGLGYKEWKPGAAWIRACIYFCICNIISVITGTFDELISRPIATITQFNDPTWIIFCVSCFAYIFVAYWILWAKMTLTFDREYYLGSEIVFGLLWGFSMGQVLLSFYHLWNQTNLPVWGVYLTSYACMGTWQYFIQDYFWDIYVSPEHDTPKSIKIKTLVSHIPNVAICLLFLLLYGNYFIYLLTQIFALVAASVFQRFPAPWASGSFHAPRTKPGIFGLSHGAGYEDCNKNDVH